MFLPQLLPYHSFNPLELSLFALPFGTCYNRKIDRDTKTEFGSACLDLDTQYNYILYQRKIKTERKNSVSTIMPHKKLVNVLVAAATAATLGEAFVPMSSTKQWKHHSGASSQASLSVMRYTSEESATSVTRGSSNSQWFVDTTTATSFDSFTTFSDGASSSSSSSAAAASSLLSSMVNDQMDLMDLGGLGAGGVGEGSSSASLIDSEILSADLVQPEPEAYDSDEDDVTAPGSERDLFLSLVKNGDEKNEEQLLPKIRGKVLASVRETGHDSMRGYIKTMCNHELLNKNEEIVLAREIQVLLKYEEIREDLEASLLR